MLRRCELRKRKEVAHAHVRFVRVHFDWCSACSLCAQWLALVTCRTGASEVF